MCVIVIKPPNVRLTDDDIERMWNRNSDGAGIAYWDGEKIVVKKGLMTKELVIDVMRPLQEQQVFLHFRLATHGGVRPELTHPFGVSNEMERALSASAHSVLFHNGIISGYGNSGKTGIESDTLDFSMNVLAHLPSDRDRVRLLDKVVSGKFILLSSNNNGVYWALGGFETSRSGLRCSNLYWEPYETYRPNGNCWEGRQKNTTHVPTILGREPVRTLYSGGPIIRRFRNGKWENDDPETAVKTLKDSCRTGCEPNSYKSEASQSSFGFKSKAERKREKKERRLERLRMRRIEEIEKKSKELDGEAERDVLTLDMGTLNTIEQ